MLLPNVKILECCRERLHDQFIARSEVFVKASNRNAQFLHHIGQHVGAEVIWCKPKPKEAGRYDENEPVPVGVEDLGTLAASHPTGPVATKLKWEALTTESFERLIFALISSAKGYENPEWLMHTNAPDRGRDLSVTRVVDDPLGGVMRSRVLIQCKHWGTKSVSVGDISELKDQTTHWEPPKVHVLVIATSGRFTSDAVALIEKQNAGDRALRVEMWPESHLERLLATRPALIAEFSLR